MRQYVRKKFLLTEEEQRNVRNGNSPFQTKTWSKAQIFFIEEAKKLQLEGKKIDYSLQKGEVQTRIWFDSEFLNFKVQFCFEQVEVNMREIENDIIADIEDCWRKKRK